ncbi:hypothetical protein Pfo_023161 [Paulownia fortunei]|nr:hypothetical protein Pfo_023161 [Paulownia fortunei]
MPINNPIPLPLRLRTKKIKCNVACTFADWLRHDVGICSSIYMFSHSKWKAFKMGNCIGAAFEKVGPNEGDKELKFWAIVDEKKFSSGPSLGCQRAPLSKLCKGQLPLSEMLKSGEIYHLPKLIQQHSSYSLQTPADVADCNGQRVKIVVNKQQLELLMGSKEEIQLRPIVLVKRVRKWRPSLAAIPEL